VLKQNFQDKISIRALSGIYRITCTESIKIYIGSSGDCRSRFVDHRKVLRRGCHANQHLQNAFNKYGESCFQFEVIREVGGEQLLDEEQIELDAVPWECTFNIIKRVAEGPAVSRPIAAFSPVTGQKIAEYFSVLKARAIHGGRPGACARGEQNKSNGLVWVFSDEVTELVVSSRIEKANQKTRSKGKSVIGVSLSGELISRHKSISIAAETNGICSASVRRSVENRTSSNQVFWARPSEWENADQFLATRIHRSRTKKVKQFDPLSGQLVAVFNSVTEAAKAVGGKLKNISSACTGHVKTSRGFRWEFVEN